MAAPLLTRKPLGTSVLGPDGTPTILEQIGSGLVTGFREIPLVGEVFDRGLTGSGFFNDADLEGMAQTAKFGPAGQVSEFAAEWIPQLLGGAAVWSAGRKLAVGAVGQIASKAIGGEVGAQAVRAAAMAGAKAGDVAPLLTRMMGGPLQQQLANTVLLLRQGAPGVAFENIPKSAILRTAEILGGNSLYGAVEVGDALLEGKPFVESLKEGGIAFALGAVAETGLTVGAKALLPGAREVDQGLAAARSVGKTQQFFDGVKQGLRTQSRDTQLELQTALQKIGQYNQLVNSAGLTAANAALGGEVAAARVTLTTASQSLKAIKGQQKVLTKSLAEDPTGFGMLGVVPIGGKRFGAWESGWHSFLLAVAETPEQLSKKLGPSAARMMRAFQRAEVHSSAMSGKINTAGLKMNETAHLATNTPLPKFDLRGGQGSKFLLDYAEIFDAAGKGAAGRTALRNFAIGKGLGAQQANDLVDMFEKQFVGDVSKLHKALEGVGMKPRLQPSLIPMVIKEGVPEEQLVNDFKTFFKASGMVPGDVAVAVKKLFNLDAMRKRGTMFSGHDAIADLMPQGMTLKRALALGAPLEGDPVIAWHRYMSGGYKRLAYANELGPNFELVKVMRGAVEQEGASVGLYNSMVDGALLRDYGTQASRSFAALATNIQTVAKMPFAFVPNSTQWINNLVQWGAKATFGSFGKTARQNTHFAGTLSMEDAVRGTGLMDSILAGRRESALDPNFRTPLGWLADAVYGAMPRPLNFNAYEGFNRLNGGGAGLWDGVRTLTMMSEGRLRGIAHQTASRRLQNAGVNVGATLDSISKLKAQGLTSDQALAQIFSQNQGRFLKELGWRSVQTSQFTPSPTRKPTYWNTPAGRVLTQFKTFALGQSRFMRDSVISEAAKGNFKPLAYATSIYPIAGHLVADTRALLRNKPNRETGLDRVLLDFGAVGGYALAGDFVMSIKKGRFAETLVGPTVSDIGRYGQSLFNGDSDKMWKDIQGLPLYNAVTKFFLQPLGAVTAASIQAVRDVEFDATDRYEGAAELDVPTLAEYGRTTQ